MESENIQDRFNELLAKGLGDSRLDAIEAAICKLSGDLNKRLEEMSADNSMRITELQSLFLALATHLTSKSGK